MLDVIPGVVAADATERVLALPSSAADPVVPAIGWPRVKMMVPSIRDAWNDQTAGLSLNPPVK
jgi:hypothetical protein